MTSFFDKLTLLRDRDTIALAPYPTILADLAGWYASAGEFEAAVIVELVLVYRVCPYVYPEPWHPSRVTRLWYLADKLGELVYGSSSLTDLTVLEHVTAAKLDIFPALYAVLLLVAEFGPRSHGESSRLMKEVRSLLSWLDQMPMAEHADIATMKYHGIRDGDGSAIARESLQRLELLAEVNLLCAVLQTVDCTGAGHVTRGTRRNPPSIARPRVTLREPQFVRNPF
jgi:hypothetical protein